MTDRPVSPPSELTALVTDIREIDSDDIADSAELAEGLLARGWSRAAPQADAGLREAIKADLTALGHLTPEDWQERRGADPIARTINAARDIVDARFAALASASPEGER